MYKKFILILFLFILLLPGAALAVNQSPNASVYLGSYNTRTSWTSNYCTATLEHLNLVIHNYSGTGKFTVQRRAPNKTWTNLDVGYIYGSATKTYNINSVKGHDYRIKMAAKVYAVDNPRGQVTCW